MSVKKSSLAWAVGSLLVATWVVLYFLLSSTQQSVTWLPDWATVFAVLAPLAWIIIYTLQGVFGPGKWWQSDLGVNMVWLETAAICTNGLLAWAVLFNHGLINSPPVAWAYIGGLIAGGVIITWRSVIWLRNYGREPALVVKVRELTAERDELRAKVYDLTAAREERKNGGNARDTGTASS